MFVDASALTAILAGESDAPQIVARMERAVALITSPIAVWETAVAIGRLLSLPPKDATQAVLDYLKLADIELRPVPPESAVLALDAFDRYGKGRHKAQLNMGDCFAYACARHAGNALLYKGSDFALTDIDPA